MSFSRDLTSNQLARLGLDGDNLKIVRSNGKIESGWKVNLYYHPCVRTVDGKLILMMMQTAHLPNKPNAHHMRGVFLEEICSVNDLNFESISTQITQM